MNVDRIIDSSFANFERLLRWVYPGLLFWFVLPATFAPASKYQMFYDNISVLAQIALIIASGFLIYLIQRYVVHELLLAILFCRGVGAAVNFNKEKGRQWYPWANGKIMWVRFGQRPNDADAQGKCAEDRFDRYMVSRMASVHALGCTILIGVAAYIFGMSVAFDSVFKSWSPTGVAFYIAGLLLAVTLWVWQAIICGRAEQNHYTPPDNRK